MSYQQIIFDATGCAWFEIEKIEDIMRNDIFHSTLDWQTKEELEKAAREAFRVIRPYPCLKCSERRRTVEDLEQHQRTVHGATIPRVKSGVEYLAQHPGWKMPRKRKIWPKNENTKRFLVRLLKSMASALEHGRYSSFQKKLGAAWAILAEWRELP